MKKGVSVIGKLLLAIVIIILAAPWIDSELLHIRVAFHPPQGNIYVMEDNTGSYAITFPDDDHMYLYYYAEVKPFEVPSIAGIKMEYRCGGYGSLGIGRVHFNPNPSLLLWRNYEIYEQGEERISFNLLLEKAKVIDYTLTGSLDRETIQTTELSVFSDYIVFAGEKYTLIDDENDVIDYKLLRFDKYGTEIE